MKPNKADEKESMEFLLKYLKPGDTIYTIQRHVSRSGMTRIISPVIIIDGKPVDISWCIANIGMYQRKYPNEGLTVHGCGMDMGFHVVYQLSCRLLADGYALKQKWL